MGQALHEYTALLPQVEEWPDSPPACHVHNIGDSGGHVLERSGGNPSAGRTTCQGDGLDSRVLLDGRRRAAFEGRPRCHGTRSVPATIRFVAGNDHRGNPAEHPGFAVILPMPESPTCAAALTPTGTGAIATLAVRGPRAWEVVQSLFRPWSPTTPWPPASLEPGRFWLGRFGQDPEKKTADHVVLTIRRLGSDPYIELHCHGGAMVVRWLLEIMAARGLTVCSWQEFDRTFGDDPYTSLARAALAEAPTARTAAILLDQCHGAFSRAWDAIRIALLRGDKPTARSVLEPLVRQAPLGRHLTSSWRVAVLGAPNVGKSSLVNALAGFQRSIVAPTPGTTRNVVTTTIAIDGWPVEIADTAGLREEPDALEKAGIDRGRRAAHGADLCLWILDASAAPVLPTFAGPKVQLVVNKIDLPPAWQLNDVPSANRVSAQTGAGLLELYQAISQWLVPDPPAPSAAVPFSRELAAELEALWTLLEDEENANR